ncbi:hypothetical protein DFH08DRAFT_821771 [Mycena albidolilacea]|uniref:Uncharacterized protein n=1 Tax=Mycena albidolilacea TaxID=1033008 RepID=A0AAD6Z9K1_9AGAR|nr:hypothetical protein DFH08DRAFT_821771 [Mycena albidolilacea]
MYDELETSSTYTEPQKERQATPSQRRGRAQRAPRALQATTTRLTVAVTVWLYSKSTRGSEADSAVDSEGVQRSKEIPRQRAAYWCWDPRLPFPVRFDPLPPILRRRKQQRIGPSSTLFQLTLIGSTFPECGRSSRARKDPRQMVQSGVSREFWAKLSRHHLLGLVSHAGRVQGLKNSTPYPYPSDTRPTPVRPVPLSFPGPATRALPHRRRRGGTGSTSEITLRDGRPSQYSSDAIYPGAPAQTCPRNYILASKMLDENGFAPRSRFSKAR